MSGRAIREGVGHIREGCRARSEHGSYVGQAAPAGGSSDRPIDVSWAEIRVGKIVAAEPHPQSDKLYVETIDLGEASPRIPGGTMVNAAR